MKKEQKIIELRTASKLRISELRTKIAFAHSEAAGERARIMTERSEELNGLKADSTERFDVLAKYRAKLARLQEKNSATVAQLKYEIQQTKSGCEKLCAAAEDDPEPAKEQQETVYCDGSEYSARIVARRLINKMPHVPAKGYLNVHIIADTYADKQEYFVSVSYGDRMNHATEIFSNKRHTAELESDFVEKARMLFAEERESGNSHVAAPMSRALDAIFSGNPVEEYDNLISDTVKDRKDAGNE